MIKKEIIPEKIIKITVIEKPKNFEIAEGLYDLRYGDKPKDSIYYDIITLSKELSLLNINMELALDTLQNFRKVFINLDTGEITS